jgi:hypothetical protein
MPVTVKKAPKGEKEIVVTELNIHSIDRTKKDVSNWRSALISAESVYYPNRTRLYDIYEEVLLDGHLSGIIDKRIDSVLNKSLYFEKDGRRITEMDVLIHSLPFRDIVRTVMQTRLWGISGIEFLPGRDMSFAKIPRKHIKPNLGIISYEQNGTDGIAYSELPNVWIMGDADDLGLLAKCAPYALYKKGNLADWAEYIEIFGQPVRIVKYDSYDDQTKQELKKILAESGSSLAMMLPKTADFDMKDGRHAYGDGTLHLFFLNVLNAEMSVLVLGNTETTVSSPKSGYAQSAVHQDQQQEIVKSDLIYTAGMLNSAKFLDILSSYDYPIKGGHFAFAQEPDLNYLDKRLGIDKQVAEIVPVAKDYWYQNYGIPRPE